jgi:putative membrane protein
MALTVPGAPSEPPSSAFFKPPAGVAGVSLPTMTKLLVKWLLSGAALLFVAYVYSGVEVKTFTAALIAAFVIGLLNTVVRPILVILTLPVTIVTLGLFLFVINALMFWAASGVLDGFHVRGFLAALIGSLIYSLLGVIIESALESLFAQK